MGKGHVVMGLLFYPRGGSAYVARYLGPALDQAGWSLALAAGSLGHRGDDTHAPTFFRGLDVHCLDYTHAVQSFTAGGDPFIAPVPMHPSYEDRDDAPDAVLAAVDPGVADHLSQAWVAPLRAAGADRAHVFHLHHLTPQFDAAYHHWPSVPRVVHLHGTELKLIGAIEERAALAGKQGETLASMPAVTARGWSGVRWDRWRHGEFWAARLRAQARLADHLIAVSPDDRATAISILGVPPERVTVVPNGVDLDRFRPRPRTPGARRAAFRRWLVEDPRGWSPSGPPGTMSYGERDLDRLLGGGDDATVLVSVGRFTAAKRIPTLIRAFAAARPRFEQPGSLVIWGGHPGEWEGEHPVTVAEALGADGVYFAGWRGHEDLPEGLAACDVLVIPSVGDSYPQTPLEAMAVGLPILATASGGLPSMIDVDVPGPTGWLVPPDDVDALADALVRVVNRPDERTTRAANALAHARTELSWKALVPRFEAAYAAGIEHRHRRTIGG